MEYRVLNNFEEREHDGHFYAAGKPYPAEGYKLSKKRADFLCEVHETYGIAFLVPVEPEPEQKPEKEIEPEQKAEPKKEPVKKAAANKKGTGKKKASEEK